MKLKIYITLLLLPIFGATVNAQEVWTLNDCISYALTHNLQLNDSQFNTDSATETYRQSVRDLLPTLNASANYIINYGRSTDPFTNDVITTDFFQNRYSLESSIDLFQGFQKLNTIRASRLLQKANMEEMDQQKYLLAFRVMQAFYDISFFEGLVANAKEQLAVSETNFNLVEKQIEIGLKAGADKYEAESILLTDQLNVTQSENQLQAAKLQLIQEMNLENSTDISVIADLEKPTAATTQETDSIYNQAKEFLPLLKAQELRAQAAKKQVQISRGALYPSLSLFAGTGTGYFETTRDSITGKTAAFREQFDANISSYVGVQLNIPISNGWSGRSSVKQSKIEKLRAENNVNIQKQELFKTIQTLVQTYNAAKVEYEMSSKKIAAQKVAFSIAQKRYEKGMINSIELLTAKNLYAAAQNENLQAQLKQEISKSTLEFYNGNPFFSIN